MAPAIFGWLTHGEAGSSRPFHPDYRGGNWTWGGSYDERDVPKAAGFRYDSGTRMWSTSDVDTAAKLRSYCDTDASEAIDRTARERACIGAVVTGAVIGWTVVVVGVRHRSRAKRLAPPSS